MLKLTVKRLFAIKKKEIDSIETDSENDIPSRLMSSTGLSSCGCFFGQALEMVPLHGSPANFFWPLSGIGLGTAAKLAFKGALTPEEQRRALRHARRGAGVVAVATGAFLANHLRSTPESGRVRIETKWPWANIDKVASMDPMFEIFLQDRVLPQTHQTSSWVSGIFQRLKKGNIDNENFTYQWNLKVIDRSVAALLCFVNPDKRNIWMTEFYLGLVDDDAQLAYVLGHELSHVICEHAKDFCFMEFVQEAALFTTGFLVGWTAGAATMARSPINMWGRFVQASRYLGIIGVTCYLSAVFSNVFWVLPYRRKLELEADVVGLKLAANACFDVDAIPRHWITLNFDTMIPNWRSTHPAAMARERLISSLLPWAHKIARLRGCDESRHHK